MQIVKLQIKNFLSISDAEIRPGQINQIVGRNNQGKTTILRALEVAFKGSTDGSLVKKGEEQAEVIVEFNDQLSVRRRIKANGSQDLTVKKAGFKADSPQNLLNGLFDAGAFNPLELLDPKRRTDVLLKAIELKVTEEDLRNAVGEECPVPLPPLDYSQHGLKVAEQAHKYFYQRRAEANKAAKAKAEEFRVKKAELPAITKSSDPRTDEELRAAVATMRTELGEEKKKSAIYTERIRQAQGLEAAMAGVNQSITQVQHQMDVLQQRLADLEAQKMDLEISLTEARIQADQVRPEQDRTQEINESIMKVQEELTRRAQVSALQERHKMVDQVGMVAEDAQEFAGLLDGVVERLGSDFRAELMKRAELPIEGLAYENDQFFLDGCSIDNLSSSKTLKLAVAVARKLAARTKLICIDGAELLDDESYAALRKEIENDGFVYFITKVGSPFEHAGDQITVMEGGQALAQAVH